MLLWLICGAFAAVGQYEIQNFENQFWNKISYIILYQKLILTLFVNFILNK